MDGLTLDIWHDGVLVHANAQNLTLSVHSDNTVVLLVLGRGEDGLSRDSVHVDALTRLEVVEMNEAEFCNEVDDTVLWRDLHSHGKVVGGFGREEHVDGLFLERSVGCLMANLDNVELRVSDVPPKDVPWHRWPFSRQTRTAWWGWGILRA
jgi:hypothetical protein